MNVQPGASSHEDDSLQFLWIPEGVEECDSPAHGVPAKDHIFVTAGCDETPHPFQITFDVMAGFAGGMSGKVDGL
jgi:hypothetical protein